MFPTVKSIEEAREFFLRNASGSCMCESPRGSVGKIVSTFAEAEEFFKSLPAGDGTTVTASSST